MTFIELVRQLAQETGVAGANQTPTPATVVGQVGELDRLVDWTRRAWLDIQGRVLWPFLWEQAVITIPAGVNCIATTIPATRWIKDSAHRNETSSDGKWLTYFPWVAFRDRYGILDIAQRRLPTAWSIRPDNKLVVNATPAIDAVFTVERYRNPQTLVNDADVPLLPDDLHELILYTAMVKYASFDEAGTTRATAEAERSRMDQDLKDRLLPEMQLGGVPIGEDCY